MVKHNYVVVKIPLIVGSLMLISLFWPEFPPQLPPGTFFHSVKSMNRADAKYCISIEQLLKPNLNKKKLK